MSKEMEQNIDYWTGPAAKERKVTHFKPMDGYTRTNYYETCAYRLPCGVCIRTNSMCPIGYYANTPIVTCTSSSAERRE